MLSTMPGEISVAIAHDVHAPHHHPSAHGLFPDAGVNRLTPPDAKVFKKHSLMKLQIKREAPTTLKPEAQRRRTWFGTSKTN